ncbi:MAG: phosphatase PAP2 family protein [Lactobacillales bacterium]|nr:phosphatase PAP2 family protein [Lactobacillales bacterium]
MKKENKKILIVVAVFAALLILGGIFDESIAKALTNQDSVWATIWQSYGMFPSKLLPFIAGLVVAFAAFHLPNNEIRKWIQIAGGFGFAWLSAVTYAKEALTYTAIMNANIADKLPLGKADNDHANALVIPFGKEMLIAGIIFVIGAALAYVWLRNKTPEQFKRLVIVAIGGVAVTFIAPEIVDTMKGAWGRFRPYEILTYKVDGAHFTSWWHINGNNGHKSFPSGHSCQGAMLLYLPFFIERNKFKLQKIATVLCGAYAVSMMFSRMVVGAHFLSDVATGATVTLLTIFVVTRALGMVFVESENELKA